MNPKIIPKDPYQRNKEPYEKIQIVIPNNWLLYLNHCELNYKFFSKKIFKLLYVTTMHSSHLTSITHTQTLQWFSSVVPSIISIIPEICQKCKYVGPTADLPSFENQCNSLFYTHAVLSPLIFFPHQHAYHYL